jgi:hypothetical protein
MKTKTLKKTPKSEKRNTTKAEITRMSQLPTTQGMFSEFRQEMKSDLARLENKMDTRFTEIVTFMNNILQKMDARWEARFNTMEGRFVAIDERFNAVDAKFVAIDESFNSIDVNLKSMDSKLYSIDARTHRSLMIVEEQKVAIKLILDGHTMLSDHVQRHDQRFSEVDSFLAGFKR